ncbi:MAG: hypothetical protein JWM65_891 [Sphingomonas bacterium]|nr:hypothetical protein [Sphingomonas bacterium]
MGKVGGLVLRRGMFTALTALLCGQASPAIAQAATQPSPAENAAAAPDLRTHVPDPAIVPMPNLAFTPSPEIEGNFDKYYYFHRDDTGFAEALADLRECDDFARGMATRSTPTGTPYGETLYPMAYTAGGVIGNALLSGVGAAMLSADARAARRINMRRCMHYKGYQRFGLEKGLWQKFNFEVGYASIDEAGRQRMLAQQARVASTAGPSQKDQGL